MTLAERVQALEDTFAEITKGLQTLAETQKETDRLIQRAHRSQTEILERLRAIAEPEEPWR